jgi:hypothetical protein
MRKLLLAAILLASPACLSTTQTVSSAGGGIPPRPPGAVYGNWEYFCGGQSGGIGAAGNINDMLARAGAEGWELVNFSDGVFCFKRPVSIAITPAPANPYAPAPAAPAQ